MPVFSRKVLRQTLGYSYTRDMIVSNSDITATGATSGVFKNIFLADSGLIGQGLYENAYIRDVVHDNDYRVATFNAGSGAFVTVQTVAGGASGSPALTDEFEIHSRISGADKDRAIDNTLKEIRVRREVGIMTVVDGDAIYSIEGAASPHYVSDVLDCYYFASPFGSLNRGQARFVDFQIVPTGTGRELRISPALAGSQQIILDAILELTLGASSAATVNIPDDTWILAGAAAKCYGMMIQNAPGQNAGELATRRKEWAGKFSSLSSRFSPYPYDRKIRLGETDT